MNNTSLQTTDFHMPAEWEQHIATWLSWPYDRTTFPHLVEVENAYIEFMTVVLPLEKMNLLVLDETVKEKVLLSLKKNNAFIENLTIHIVDYCDVWIRDYGPIFVVNKDKTQLAITKWQFNAWGNKYPELLGDNEIPAMLNKDLELPFFETGIILEGGSIDVNGKGSLLTTEQCLLNKNRNANLTKKEIEKKLQDFLGVTNIVWLKDGLEGDDTDGHIDDIARFVNSTTILYAIEENKIDANYERLQENYEILKNAVDQDGKPFTLIPVPMPQVLVDDARRLPASYMNFYITNGVIVCPIFDGKNDKKVLEILEKSFPDRKIIGINAKYFVYGNGAFHCATQQQPKINY